MERAVSLAEPYNSVQPTVNYVEKLLQKLQNNSHTAFNNNILELLCKRELTTKGTIFI